MLRRAYMCRVILAAALAISLAIGGGAAVAAAGSTAFSPSAPSTLVPSTLVPSTLVPSTLVPLTLVPLNSVPVPMAHVSGMVHGQDTGGTDDLGQQILCAVACLGLTAVPGVPAPDHTLVHRPLPASPDIAVADTSDQVLLRPTSPPPRLLATI